MNMKNRIKLVFWHTSIENYGDILSPYIINKLSGLEIQQKNLFISFKYLFKRFIKNIINLNFTENKKILFPFEKNLLAIGSILKGCNKKSSVWGSGFMRDSEKCVGGNIIAVRGKYTYQSLLKQQQKNPHIKINKECVFGDPALLLPLILKLEKKDIHNIGIIPHFSEYSYFKNKYSENIKIINLQSNDIESVTKEIISCKYILSSSLHGIIVAHAYGIPAIWIEHTGLELNTNGFKFKDYFSSANIDIYQPYKSIDSILIDRESVIDFFNQNKNISLPNIDIKQIQMNLLKCTPFKLLKEYESLIILYEKRQKSIQ